MPKITLAWNPADYATVAERITAFYAAFPFGRIVTELQARTERQVTFKAAVYRSPDEPHPAATGWATEREGDGEINAVACLENAETSAIGRALANLGFSASRLQAPRRPPERPTSPQPGVRLVREPAPPRAARSATPPGPDASLQRAADALLDVLTLLQEAERCGYPADDARRVRGALDARSVPPSALRRAERELRAWFEQHVPGPPLGDSPPDGPPDGGRG